ncbi:hypothetical protein EV363DRAFT_1410256 [Boletus edulis]|nr:hypothetical protein EV363DRAFT_1410256 [Boletus edulis]
MRLLLEESHEGCRTVTIRAIGALVQFVVNIVAQYALMIRQGPMCQCTSTTLLLLSLEQFESVMAHGDQRLTKGRTYLLRKPTRKKTPR